MTRQTRSILIATALSPISDHVLRAAADLAEASGADLHVIHVHDSRDSRFAGEWAVEKQRRVHEARLGLLDLLQRTGFEGKVASARLGFDVPYRTILERAKEVDADLLVIGPHRGLALHSRVLGTTADRLVRTARMPVLIVQEPLSLPLRRIVAPTDLSFYAQISVGQAMTWADAFGPGDGEPPAVVHALHVIPRTATDIDFNLNRVEWSQQRLSEQVDAARAARSGGRQIEVHEEVIREARPATAIVKKAEDLDANLLVLGTHGRGMLERAMVGSVAAAVARQATRAVLLIPSSVSASLAREEAEEAAEPVAIDLDDATP